MSEKNIGWVVFLCLLQWNLGLAQITYKDDVYFKLDTPVFTIVKELRSGAKQEGWEVFRDAESTQGVGFVHPGDTAEVIGWSYWLFYIKSKDANGFISLLALERNKDLHPIRTLIVKKSEEKGELDIRNYIPPPSDPIAHLALVPNKNSIFVGECVTLRYEFNVGALNPVKLQFYDLANQISQILKILEPQYSWESMSLGEIIGVNKTIGSDSYTSYVITQRTFCPSVVKDLVFSETELTFLTGTRFDEVLSDFIKFKSEEKRIKVKPLPTGNKASSFSGYTMIGEFELKDSVLTTNVKTGVPINYVVSISGEGLTYPIPAPKITMENMTARIVNVNHSDTVINDSYFSKKDFTYSLVFESPGEYNLKDKIHFNYYTPDGVSSTLSSRAQVIVVGDKKQRVALKEVVKFRDLIAIDNSKSMLIEDYKPSRLRAATKGVADFIKKRKVCDVGVFAFAGDVNYRLINEPNCVTESMEELDFDKVNSGTAIGNAIFHASQIMANDNAQKKLVIIGDGDNTAGNISPEFAIELMNNYNLKIFTIGIGNEGEVPFGRDNTGKPYMIDNTFDDTGLKKIASLTGAKYYHAESAEDLTLILSQIFDN